MSKKLTYDQTNKLIRNVVDSLVVQRTLRDYSSVGTHNLSDIMRGSHYAGDVSKLGYSRRAKLINQMNSWLDTQRECIKHFSKPEFSTYPYPPPNYGSPLTNPCSEITLKGPQMCALELRELESRVALNLARDLERQQKDALSALHYGASPNDNRHTKDFLFHQFMNIKGSATVHVDMATGKDSTVTLTNFRQSTQPEKEMSTSTKHYVDGQEVAYLSEGNLVDMSNNKDTMITNNKEQIESYKKRIDALKVTNISLVEDNRVIKGHIASKRGKTVTKPTPTPAPAPNPSV